jgi:hypothetical protein
MDFSALPDFATALESLRRERAATQNLAASVSFAAPDNGNGDGTRSDSLPPPPSALRPLARKDTASELSAATRTPIPGDMGRAFDRRVVQAVADHIDEDDEEFLALETAFNAAPDEAVAVGTISPTQTAQALFADSPGCLRFDDSLAGFSSSSATVVAQVHGVTTAFRDRDAAVAPPTLQDGGTAPETVRPPADNGVVELSYLGAVAASSSSAVSVFRTNHAGNVTFGHVNARLRQQQLELSAATPAANADTGADASSVRAAGGHADHESGWAEGKAAAAQGEENEDDEEARRRASLWSASSSDATSNDDDDDDDDDDDNDDDDDDDSDDNNGRDSVPRPAVVAIDTSGTRAGGPQQQSSSARALATPVLSAFPPSAGEDDTAGADAAAESPLSESSSSSSSSSLSSGTSSSAMTSASTSASTSPRLTLKSASTILMQRAKTKLMSELRAAKAMALASSQEFRTQTQAVLKNAAQMHRMLETLTYEKDDAEAQLAKLQARTAVSFVLCFECSFLYAPACMPTGGCVVCDARCLLSAVRR